jgi:hypothetical protein
MAVSNIELLPVFLRELRKAMATGKKKALGASKANMMSASTFACQSGLSASIPISP